MAIHQNLNLTPFATAIGSCVDRDGRALAVAVVRATLQFTAKGELSAAPPAAQQPVVEADVPFGDPATSGLKYASELSPPKPGTDVAIVGHAYGRGRKEVEAGFRVGALEKKVIVCGPRAWAAKSPVTIAGPVPFQSVPLQYEQAFGGSGFPDNPVGAGFAPDVVAGARLPSIEYPDARFTAPKQRPRPAGLGFIPSGFRQRARFAGTFDGTWERTRRPLLPADLDERFWNTVPQDQVLAPKLRGGEPLLLLNVHPEAPKVALRAPRLAFVAELRIKDDAKVLPMTADTLLLEPDDGRLVLTFRAILDVGDDLLRLRSAVFRQTGTV